MIGSILIIATLCNLIRIVELALLSDSYGSITCSVQLTTDYISWTINPSLSSRRIFFVFNSLNINSAQMQVYDSSVGSSGTPLFSCVSCGHLLPPPFFSLTNSVTMYIRAVSGNGFVPSSFSLQYAAELIMFPISPLRFTFFLNMGYAKVTPLLISYQLPANSQISWLINVGFPTKIVFNLANYYFGSRCLSYLAVYDGLEANPANLIYYGCTQADSPQFWFNSLSGKALVYLQGSPMVNQNISFELTYFADTELYNCGALTQPDTLIGESMIITDGSKSTNEMRRSVSCSWLIAPLSSSAVTLIFNYMSLKDGGTVTVFDSCDTSGTILYKGIGPTSTTPPPIKSSAGCMYVVYISNTLLSTGYLGFQGIYQTDYGLGYGAGSSFTQLTMSSALHVSPSWYNNHQRWNLSHSRALRTVFPLTLSAFTSSWSIAPSSATGALQIVLNTIQLQRDENFTLFDGNYPGAPILLRVRGPTSACPSTWVRTSGLTALLQLTTVRMVVPDPTLRSNPRSGFDASYTSDGDNHLCGFTNSPALVTSQSFTLTDGSSSGSPMHPGQYCVWNIVPPGSQALYLYFNRLNLINALLTVHAGVSSPPTEATWIRNANAVPAPLIITTNASVVVQFSSLALSVSAPSSYGTGFSLSYFALQSVRSGPGGGVIPLYCSSVIALAPPPLASNPDFPNNFGNYSWVVRPANSSGNLLLCLDRLPLETCGVATLTISSGSTKSTRVFCGRRGELSGQTRQWLIYPSTALPLSIQYTYTGPLPSGPIAIPRGMSNYGSGSMVGFQLSYYSDGPNVHCGFHRNPAVLRSVSMIFSDGSASSQTMYPGQHCEWLLQPLLPGNNTVPDGAWLVAEFLRHDLIGGHLSVYDGFNSSGALLWQCDSCHVTPRSLVSVTGMMFLVFKTPDRIPESGFGKGFLLTYWTLIPPTPTAVTKSKVAPHPDPVYLLELPPLYTFPAPPEIDPSDPFLTFNANYTSSSFILTASDTTSFMQYKPYSSFNTEIPDLEEGSSGYTVLDGRPHDATQLYSPARSPVRLVCGIVSGQFSGDNVTYLRSDVFVQAMRQSTANYLVSDVSGKSLQSFNLSSTPLSSAPSSAPAARSAQNCVYQIRSSPSEPRRAVSITVKRFNGREGGALHVFTGMHGYDDLALQLSLVDSGPRVLTAPCGIATVILSPVNSSGSSPRALGPFLYELELEYTEVHGDHGQACDAYVQSLLGRSASSGNVAAEVVAAIILFLICLLLFLRLRYGARIWTHIRKCKRYLDYEPSPHPLYTPLVDRLTNALAWRGSCCICKESGVQVIRLKCKHAICLSDMRCYVDVALHDISKFPLKCPMHYDSCPESIPITIAKRFVPNLAQFQRFLDFHDRAVLGEGMRCIYCHFFVNFNLNGKVIMVECPHCVRRFCLRCRQPWHYVGRCTVEVADDLELENWKEGSGAQKCPGCSKLIEKEDPDTCNHMVHKITDSIPCVRTRTDFCYLCGLEVLPEYPHEEVNCPGVNHFPDGVFQDCRTVKRQEAEVEREMYRKKVKRKRNYGREQRSAVIVPVFREVDPLSDPQSHSGQSITPTATPTSGSRSTPSGPRDEAHFGTPNTVPSLRVRRLEPALNHHAATGDLQQPGDYVAASLAIRDFLDEDSI